MVPDQRFDVAIVGAGAIGASVAYELAGRGASVAVLERGAGWAAGCSWGNAGLICPSHASHYASPRDLANAGRWALRRDSPFSIRPRTSLVPFGARLAASMRPSHQRRVANILRDLAIEGLEGHTALAASGLRTGFMRRGLIDVYETAAGFRAAHHVGGSTVLSPSELVALEPALAGSYAGGVLHPEEAHCDPAAFVEAIGAAAVARGASFVPGADVRTLRRQDGAVAIATSAGTVTAAAVLIAAGAASTALARICGRPLALQAGKGYSVDLTVPTQGTPGRPMLLQEARVAVTPLEGRLRLAGTRELTGPNLRIHAGRLAAIRAAGARTLPATRGADERGPWAGLRPCSADGLPLIGWIATRPPVAVATGHAMLGLTLAPATARLTTDLVEGRGGPELDALGPRRRAW